jgi:sortase A
MPGTLVNAAIAGHRTTYGAPFGDIDKVKVGDEITIQTLSGVFVYRVYQERLIVGKRDTYVVDNTPTAQLTLTSCHPKGSAEQRIVVKADLVAEKSAKPAKPLPPRVQAGKSTAAGLEESLSGTHENLNPTIIFGIVALIVGIAWWWAFRRWRHPLTWVVGVIPFVIALVPFYFFLERALPAGY